jgi:hypothetical protein
VTEYVLQLEYIGLSVQAMVRIWVGLICTALVNSNILELIPTINYNTIVGSLLRSILLLSSELSLFLSYFC